MGKLDKKKLEHFIRRYEDVYFYGMRRIKMMVAESLPEGVTGDQFLVLRTVRKLGTCLPSELAARCDVNRSTMTAMVDRLVNKGYVRRVRTEKDRRLVKLAATEQGKIICDMGEEKIGHFVASLLPLLTEEELEIFLRVYEKVARSLEQRETED